MTYFVDTNILLRFLHRADPNYSSIRAAVKILKIRGDEMVTASQNFAEFWNVLTRPATARGGYGYSVQDAAYRLQFIELNFPLLPDVPAVFFEWKRLLLAYNITGVQVHDARIAALMKVHGVSRILTLNQKDFARYQGLAAVNPQQIISGQI
jgi:predicted nucleic acid-binding protein